MSLVAKGFTAVMAQRRDPPDALDYFPTPLWSTRALFRHVLPVVGFDAIGSVSEPACGEGHMAAVIAEFAHGPVTASDRSRSCIEFFSHHHDDRARRSAVRW